MGQRSIERAVNSKGEPDGRGAHHRTSKDIMGIVSSAGDPRHGHGAGKRAGEPADICRILAIKDQGGRDAFSRVLGGEALVIMAVRPPLRNGSLQGGLDQLDAGETGAGPDPACRAASRKCCRASNENGSTNVSETIPGVPLFLCANAWHCQK